MGDKTRYFLKRLRLDVMDTLSDSIGKISKSKRYQSLTKDADEYKDSLKDRILDSNAGQAISENLTNLYAFMKNRFAIKNEDYEEYDEYGNDNELDLELDSGHEEDEEDIVETDIYNAELHP